MIYIRQIDSVRGIAAFIVVLQHWMPKHYSFAEIPLANLGVNIFFVLSGFLISTILIQNKKSVDQGLHTKSFMFKSFYIRRSLRIFPIYYLAVIVLYILGIYFNSNDKISLPYFLTYTANYYFYQISSFDVLGSHLWTLAIEEQFYLIWPAVVFFTHRKYLLHVIILFLVTGFITDIILIKDAWAFLLTPTCFQLFGGGALLAYFYVYKPVWLKRISKILFYPFIVSVALYILIQSQDIWSTLSILKRPMDLLISCFLISTLVSSVIENKKPPMDFLWSNQLLVSFGKISYGIYLYHPFIWIFASKAFTYTGLDRNSFMGPLVLSEITFFVICLILLLLFASLSWLLIERPILSLKKHFNY